MSLETIFQLLVLLLVQDQIFEEGACIPTFFLTGRRKFPIPNGNDRLSDLIQLRLLYAQLFKPQPDIRIAEISVRLPGELKSDSCNKISPPVRGVKDAPAIRQPKSIFHKGLGLAGCKIHNFGAFENVADLLSISSDVLNQGCASLSGDVREIFNAPPVALNRAGYKAVPGFCRLD